MATTPYVPNTFFSNIKNSKVLDKQEELELFQKYKESGEQKHRDKLILANTRFVIRAALEFKSSGIDIHDLFSEGLYGLIHAIDHFDIKQDVKFISYAVYWIKHYIRKSINESSSVKVPTGIAKELRKKIVDGTIGQVENDNKVQMALNAMQSPMSLDSKFDDDTSNHTVGETLEDGNATTPAKLHYSQVLSDELVRLINGNLAPVKAEIILKTYGLGHYEVEQTLRDISYNSKYSHERIRQLRKEALRELQKNPEMQFYHKKYNEFTKMK